MKIHRRLLIKGGIISAASAVMAGNLMAFAEREPANEHNGFVRNSGDYQVVNAGVGGNNTFDLLQRIEKDCLASSPKLTVLMIGTNDMNSVKYVPLNVYEHNLSDLVKKITSSGSKVLLMTILPTYEPYLLTRHPAAFYQPEGVAGRRKQVNEAIKKVASKYKVPYLDLGHRFEAIGKIGTGQDSLIQNEVNSNKTDGIHPTPTGYRFIALAVYDHIMANQLAEKNIVCFGDSITRGDGSVERESYPAYLKKLLND